MVERQISNLVTRVRFPLDAPNMKILVEIHHKDIKRLRPRYKDQECRETIAEIKGNQKLLKEMQEMLLNYLDERLAKEAD